MQTTEIIQLYTNYLNKIVVWFQGLLCAKKPLKKQINKM